MIPFPGAAAPAKRKCADCGHPLRSPVPPERRIPGVGEIGPECAEKRGIVSPAGPRFASRRSGPVEGQQDLLTTKINEGNDVSEISYHKAHGPYFEAVSNALDAAGVTVEDWFADANDPRDGCITLADRDDDGDARHVAWNEEGGWFYGTSPEDGHGGIQGIWWICDDVLPEPGDVVAAVQRCIAGDHSQATLNHVYYRGFEDEGDGFEERLAAHHPKTEAATGEEKS